MEVNATFMFCTRSLFAHTHVDGEGRRVAKINEIILKAMTSPSDTEIFRSTFYKY
jgi:hypothetical protein